MKMNWESNPTPSNKEVWRRPEKLLDVYAVFPDGLRMDQAIGSHRIKSKLVDSCNLVLRNLMDKYEVIL